MVYIPRSMATHPCAVSRVQEGVRARDGPGLAGAEPQLPPAARLAKRPYARCGNISELGTRPVRPRRRDEESVRVLSEGPPGRGVHVLCLPCRLRARSSQRHHHLDCPIDEEYQLRGERSVRGRLPK